MKIDSLCLSLFLTGLSCSIESSQSFGITSVITQKQYQPFSLRLREFSLHAHELQSQEEDLIEHLEEHELTESIDEDEIQEKLKELSEVVDQEESCGFDSLGLSAQALNAVPPTWERPTPVQELAIPMLLSKSHPCVWCEAPTGSGKTGAFALPLLQLLKEQHQQERMNGSPSDQTGVRSLVVCPTRELAVQIGTVFHALSQRMKYPLSIAVIHGGVPLDPQIDKVAKKAHGKRIDVIVATPGRLVDVLNHYNKYSKRSAEEAALEQRLLAALNEKGNEDKPGEVSLTLQNILDGDLDRHDDEGRSALDGKDMLKDLSYLVLDEADRMLGRGFLSEMNNLTEILPPQVPTWLFSATFAPQVEPLIEGVMKRLGHEKPLRLSCESADAAPGETLSERQENRRSIVPSKIKVGPASTIELRTIRMEKRDRTQVLRKLLKTHKEWDRVLVFVATRYLTEHITRKMRAAKITCMELHGKLDQSARLRRLQDFAMGKTRVLIATDLASRGLDVVGLPAVVNYDLPRSTSDFVHRIGRTGRAGQHGTAVSFVTPTSEGHYNLIEQRHISGVVEREVIPGFEPDEDRWMTQAAATQISVPGVAHSNKGLDHDRMFGGIKGRRLSKKDKLREQAARKVEQAARKAAAKQVDEEGDLLTP